MMLGASTLALLLSAPTAVDFPGAQPQLAAAGGRVGLVFGEGQAIFFAGSRDGGRTFSPPVAVPTQGRLALGRHRGPRVALTGGAVVVTAMLAAGRDDGDLFAWRSTDEGRTWSAPVRLNGVAASAREGLHGMAAAGDTVAVAWLDLRAQGTRIFTAVSRDGGATWAADRLAYQSPSGTVCQCCHPSVAVSPKGEIAVMFRNAIEGARDLYLTRSGDGGRTFEPAARLGSGTWKLEACPMDGGGVAIDGRGALVTVWRREADVFLARPDQPEERLGTGRDPVIALAGDGAWSAAWRGDDGVSIQDAKHAAPRRLAEGGQAPALIALPDGSLLAAWERERRVFVAPVAR
jgi:hypothetical protein